MRNIKFLVCVFIITAANLGFAQDMYLDSREKMQFGLKTGLNYSNVYDERTDEFVDDAKFGFAGGLFVRIPIGKFLGVQPEILFSQKGFKGKGIILGNDYEFTRTTSFIDIPLQIAVKPNELITILAGPQYSYLLKQKDVFTISENSNTQEEIFKNDNIRKNILGFVAGLDININHIVIGARMGWDIQNNNGNGSSSTPRYKNAWVQATLGYTFYN